MNTSNIALATGKSSTIKQLGEKMLFW